MRFTQALITTKALQILQARLLGKANEGALEPGKIVEDGLEFRTPYPVFMYYYEFQSEGKMIFDTLAKYALGKEYESGQLGVTRGSCTEKNHNN